MRTEKLCLLEKLIIISVIIITLPILYEISINGISGLLKSSIETKEQSCTQSENKKAL